MNWLRVHFGCRTCGIVLVLLLIPGCSRNSEYYFEKGTRSAAAGNDADAILNFQKAIQKNPKLGKGYLGLGLADQRHSNLREAYAALKMAGELLPNSETAQAAFADLCLNLYVSDQTRPKAVYDQLSGVADRLLAGNAGSFEGLRLKGSVALLDHRFDQAIDWFRKADQVKPMQPNVVLPLVRSLLETNRKREAEQLALQLIAAEKTAEPTYDLLYLFYTRENRAADAEKILEQKVENNPNSATARLQLAAHYVRLKQRPEMARALKPMLDRPKEFPNGQLQVGDFYSSIGDGQEALTYYQRGLSTSPDKLLYQKRIIGTLVQQNRRDEAAKMVEVALKEHADDDELKTAKATLLLSTGKPADIEAATSIFAELVKQKPNDPARRLQLGRSAMLKGDLDSAKAELNEALRRLPSSVPLRVLLTDITLRKREFGESLRFSDEILKFEPGNLGARLARSASLIGLGRFKEARPELDKVLAKQPESVDAQMQLGSLDLVEGRSKDAADVFRKSHEAARDDLRPIEGLVEAEIAQHQSDRALQLIDQELAKAPDSAALGDLLARTALRSGNSDVAIGEYRRLLSRNPGSVDLYLKLGETLRSKGELKDALAQFEKARQVFPKDVRPVVSVAATESLMGQKEAAQNSYRRALAMQPDNPFIMNNLAYLMVERGANLDEAKRLAQEAVKKQPQQASFLDTLGSIYQKTGETDSALQIFNNLVKQYPDRPEFRYRQAVSLLKKGDRTQARQALVAALAQAPTGQLDADIRQLLSQLN